MKSVEEYEGLKIFKDKSGYYYLDVIQNSNDFEKHTLGCSDLQRLKHAIRYFNLTHKAKNFYGLELLNERDEKILRFVSNEIMKVRLKNFIIQDITKTELKNSFSILDTAISKGLTEILKA